MNPVLDYILVVKNQIHYTRQCIESILLHSPRPFRLILVDNGCTDETAFFFERLKAEPPENTEVTVLHLKENEGYTRAANRGLLLSRAPFIVILNNDTVLYPGTIEEMLQVAQSDARLGLLNPNSNEFGLEEYDPAKLAAWHGQWIERFHISGFFALIRREVFESTGLFNPVFSPGYFEDMDLSERAKRKGFYCGMAKGAYVTHYGTRTFKTSEKEALWRAHEKIFFESWGRIERCVFVRGPEDAASPEALLDELLGLVRSRFIYVYLFVPKGTAGYFRDRHDGIRVREYDPGILMSAVMLKLFSGIVHRKRISRVYLRRPSAPAYLKLLSLLLGFQTVPLL